MGAGAPATNLSNPRCTTSTPAASTCDAHRAQNQPKLPPAACCCYTHEPICYLGGGSMVHGARTAPRCDRSPFLAKSSFQLKLLRRPRTSEAQKRRKSRTCSHPVATVKGVTTLLVLGRPATSVPSQLPQLRCTAFKTIDSSMRAVLPRSLCLTPRDRTNTTK